LLWLGPSLAKASIRYKQNACQARDAGFCGSGSQFLAH